MKALFLAYFFACLNYKKRLPKLVRQSLMDGSAVFPPADLLSDINKFRIRQAGSMWVVTVAS